MSGEAAPLRPWSVPAVVLLWAVIFALSMTAATFTALDDAARRGLAVPAWRVVLDEATSHLAIAALVPALFWLHRRLPVVPLSWKVGLHGLASVPFSLAHVVLMVALRHAGAALLGEEAYRYRWAFATLLYEYRKDVLTYLVLATAIVASRRLLAGVPVPPAMPAPAAADDRQAAAPPGPGFLERFAVRKRGREVMVRAEEIDWISAAGNYAVLHVGGQTHEIRSSLARLEAELDPARFLRVHKSYIVNIARVQEVEPSDSGDWRLRLAGGAGVPLSRRYRARFQAAVPVRR